MISNLDPTCKVEQEEIFGPVVTVQPFDTEGEAVALANGTPYGLAATLWTQDVSRAPVGSNNAFPAIAARGEGDVRIAWMDDRNGFDAGGDDPDARWNTYYRSSTDAGGTWSPEAKLSAYVPGFTYKLASPKDGYLQPYGDYFELDIDSRGKTVALWGEGNSYTGPGNVWFARQQ